MATEQRKRIKASRPPSAPAIDEFGIDVEDTTGIPDFADGVPDPPLGLAGKRGRDESSVIAETGELQSASQTAIADAARVLLRCSKSGSSLAFER